MELEKALGIVKQTRDPTQNPMQVYTALAAIDTRLAYVFRTIGEALSLLDLEVGRHREP